MIDTSRFHEPAIMITTLLVVCDVQSNTEHITLAMIDKPAVQSSNLMG